MSQTGFFNKTFRILIYLEQLDLIREGLDLETQQLISQDIEQRAIIMREVNLTEFRLLLTFIIAEYLVFFYLTVI